MDLHDYQQDFLVNGVVKVTFFVADNTFARILDRSLEAKVVRLASIGELFKTKALEQQEAEAR